MPYHSHIARMAIRIALIRRTLTPSESNRLIDKLTPLLTFEEVEIPSPLFLTLLLELMVERDRAKWN